MKKILSFLISVILVFCFCTQIFAVNATNNEAEFTSVMGDVNAKSAVLMEAETGKILYSKNENEALSPASVTKIMTLLLVAEALEDGRISKNDTTRISDHAASMGGSQVFLEEGEVMSVEELIKCAVIASANDASVALAELVFGNEAAFVNKMNERANELGMESSNFENVTGLDDTTKNHVTSALDIAIMSRELIKHDIILKYSSLWQDTIRNGEFTLTNTNRLVRFYEGCNGLKTGSTDKAGFCMSATAKRNGMHLIAVVMGAETRDARNQIAKNLLDYGFATHSLYKQNENALEAVPVKFGTKSYCTLYEGEFCDLIEKTEIKNVEKIYSIPDFVTAPITSKNPLGRVEYMLNGEKIGESSIYALENIDKIGFWNLYLILIKDIFLCG